MISFSNKDFPIILPSQKTRLHRLAKYVSHGHLATYDKGHSIDLLYNDQPCYIYVVQGNLKGIINRYDGTQLSIDLLSKGTIIPSLHQIPTTLYNPRHFIAKTQVTVCYFSQKELFQIAREDEELFEDLMMQLQYELDLSRAKMIMTTGLSAPSRIIYLLQTLCSTMKPDASGAYRIPFSGMQRSIAMFLSIHHITFNRILKSFEEEGLIEKTKTHLVVPELEHLLHFLDKEADLKY